MIAIRSLTKFYGRQRVLENVSAEFHAGRVTYLLGGNGVGKTTLFKCLTGLESYAGTVEFDGRPLSLVREHVVAAFDDCALYPHLSGLENLRLLTGKPVSWEGVRAVADGVLDRTVLDKPARALSYGQRKKVHTVGLILNCPSYVFLDELANGLDYDSLQWLEAVIRELKQGCVVVASGHQFDFYDRVADDVFAVSENGLKNLEFQSAAGDRLEDLYLASRNQRPH